MKSKFVLFVLALAMQTMAVPIALVLHNSTDLENDIITYDFQVSKTPNFESIVTESTCISQGQDTTFWIADLSDSTTYYWRARACDDYSCSDYSEVWSFKLWLDRERPSVISDLK